MYSVSGLTCFEVCVPLFSKHLITSTLCDNVSIVKLRFDIAQDV